MNSKKVTNTLYDCVKLMLNGKGSVEEIAEYLSISKATVYRISKAQTFQEYKDNMSANLYMRQKAMKAKAEAEAKAKAEAETEVKTPAVAAQAVQQPAQLLLTDMQMKGGVLSANYQMNRMYDAMTKQNELLTLISNKLAFIVDELTK